MLLLLAIVGIVAEHFLSVELQHSFRPPIHSENKYRVSRYWVPEKSPDAQPNAGGRLVTSALYATYESTQKVNKNRE
jgi:hypothetical protein